MSFAARALRATRRDLQDQDQDQDRLWRDALDSTLAPDHPLLPHNPFAHSTPPPAFSTLATIPSFPDDTAPPPGEDEDATWLVIVVLALALAVTLATLIRACAQRISRLLGIPLHGASGARGIGHAGASAGHGSAGRHHGSSGPHQVPEEHDADPDQDLNENDERWALLTDAQRQAFTAAQAFQTAHPPLSVPTDISLSQYLSIQEKGVSAWEFEAPFDSSRVIVHDRTELSFHDQEASVQTNLPIPKQQEVYYWEVKMFEKSPDTVVSVGVSTKPYPNERMPGWNRHSVAYFSKDGQKYCNSPFSGHPYGPIYFEGDVVGCGYRPRTGTLFFTRNGKRIEDAYTGLWYNLFPTVGASGPCVLHVNLGQSGFVFVEANVKKWGLAPAAGNLVPPPAYGREHGSILLETGRTSAALGMPTSPGPAPPTRRPKLQSSQSRARIEAAGVLVQIEESTHSSDAGSSSISEYAKQVMSPINISLSKMSVPTIPPPQYSSLGGAAAVAGGEGGAGGNRGTAERTESESDDETTALIARTISKPIGRTRERSGTLSSIASGSGTRR
ncbi:Rsp5p-dependent ubiquitination, sorting of cargo proteins at the multivesicular body [Lunasporangiospora selenospora]|uniref:Rsp5p-dependent ubiquitination, sorting of cargo proteins at the multivesicular body n=1 Tax=Lunasporangiospora selenospora TaxID=979761 RepID=A0A9P6KAW7_9FUNG|nr:Rsp5p-dependent ubiquitination, sorting of cargo proteins at the multivesicular body [Lunasporangiospora selenospora]